jgi:hypothetical protein
MNQLITGKYPPKGKIWQFGIGNTTESPDQYGPKKRCLEISKHEGIGQQ